MSTIESALLSAIEEAALGELMSGPLVGVHVRIAVKFRAMQHDLGTFTVIDHSFQWPIPALFAKANPHPVALNTHGIQLDVTLSTPSAAVPASPAVEATAAAPTVVPTQPSSPTPSNSVAAAAVSPTATASNGDPTLTESASNADPVQTEQAQPAGGDVLGDGI